MRRIGPDWSDFSLPIILPELVIIPTHMQIFMFSAATWNRHHIHYNRDAAIAEGLPDVVVQRALIGNYFARLLTDWLGDGGEIRKLSWKVLNSAVPNRKLRCQGIFQKYESTNGADDLICEMIILNENGETVATADARVCV
jgi:hydroxyacyl-ACP dehydratase HTD2-like protein with hotdog domain